MSTRSDSVLRRAAVAGLRVPGEWVPGWFPLVVERLHGRVGPPTPTVVVQLDGYRMRLDTSEYLQRRMYYHCHEPEEARVFRRLLRPGDVVVDVGAHVGFFTLLAASLVGEGGRVHAFEPIPPSCATLEANVALNGFANVSVRRAAVSDAEGTIALGLTDDSVSLGATDYTLGGGHASVTAPAVTLDAYLREHEPSRTVRLLKMDTEGLEGRVLAGISDVLAARPPDAMVFEYNATMLARHGEDGEELLARLRGAGYRLLRAESFGHLAPLEGPLPTPVFEPSDPAGRSPLEALRVGLATRNRLFNVVALRAGVD